MYEAQMLCAILFAIASILVSLFITYQRRLFGYLTLVCAVLCLFFFVTTQVWASEKAPQHAVITTPEVSALSGPGEDYKEIIVIHNGSEVAVREISGDYALIQLPGGVGGCVPHNALEEIF
jgi:uncharacterized protein YgiM (DUF1202 family)